MDSKTFIDGFKRRVRENSVSRWVRFGIVSLIFFLWVAWLGNWWVALAIYPSRGGRSRKMPPCGP